MRNTKNVPKTKQKLIITHIKIKIYLIPSTTNSIGTFVPTWSFLIYKPIALFATSIFTRHTHIKVVKCIFPLKETREWWLSRCATTRIIQLIEATWVNKVKLRTKIAAVNGYVKLQTICDVNNCHAILCWQQQQHEHPQTWNTPTPWWHSSTFHQSFFFFQ